MTPQNDNQRPGQPQPGRRGEPNHEGGAAKDGHLDPQIDAREDERRDRQIAQERQQSTGQGSGQS
jgi:hypothetical protein